MGGDPGKDDENIMSSPLVSIIIPSYNYGHLILETLESIVQQTYTNWECIIADDGSTDNTSQVVSGFIKAHPLKEFIYIQFANQGTSAAKNKGIGMARGTLIQFLDADDLLLPDKLSIQVNLLNQQDGALVFSRSAFFSSCGGKKVYTDKYPSGYLLTETMKGPALLKRLIKNNNITVGSPLVHKDLVLKAGGFDEDLRNNEDWLFWFRISMLRPEFIYDQDERSAVEVRLHAESAMTDNYKMALGEVMVRNRMDRLLYAGGGSGLVILRDLNSDLLDLHLVRSLEAGAGMKHILTKFTRNPAKKAGLMIKGLIKLFIRLVKKEGIRK